MPNVKRLKEIQEDLEKIQKRSAEISEEAKEADADSLEKLNAELADMESRKGALEQEKADLEQAEQDAADLKDGKVPPAEVRKVEIPQEVHKMPDKEVRASKEYINAFAKYIRTSKDAECRSLLTEIGGGQVPVPAFVDDVIYHAWENEQIMSRVSRTELKGIVKVGFEVSSTAAAIHTEGGDAVAEEELKLGIVTLTPQTIKKWVSFSDETQDYQNAEAFLTYIYSEITHMILKKAADMTVAAILAKPAASTETAPAVASVASAGIMDFINARAQLSDEANSPVIIMNKASEPYYRGLAQASNYAFDPFQGMTILYNNSLDVADGTTAGTYAIVGDLSGARANCPDGVSPTMKYDDLTLATSDMIRVIGRLPMAVDVVKPLAFAKIVKSA